MAWRDIADLAVGRAIRLARWLVLPVALLLFLQWPLRDLVRAYSRDANDLAQWLFALYVSAAMTFATRERAHLAADAFAQRYPVRVRERIARVGALLCIGPWAFYVVIVAAPGVWQSVRVLEGFPDTYNPGYFLVKIAAMLLAVLAFAQAILDLTAPSRVP